MKEMDTVKLYDVGDQLYRVGKYGVDLITIVEVKCYQHYVYKDDKGHSYFNHNIVKTCFRTMEEAKEEIRNRTLIAQKRKMLKEYERKLNKELNISKEHYIVK